MLALPALSGNRGIQKTRHSGFRKRERYYSMGLSRNQRRPNAMNELALDLNQKIRAASPAAYEMLSALGKRIYFPSKGILSQSAEAKTLGKRFNATIGTALEDGAPMHLPCVTDMLDGIPLKEALLYAPSSGKPALRQAWREKLLHDNPSLKDVAFSLPVVTNGLTHALAVAADMFLDAGDRVVLPDLNWDNYLLNMTDRVGADLHFYPLFDNGRFNTRGLAAELAAVPVGEKVFTVLNFPNNPTGYTPLEEEGEAIAAALLAAAERGVKVVALVDDAYYGLFYDARCMKQSLFTKIAGKHANLMAIKADAATKECYVWGLRVGFIAFAIGTSADAEATAALYKALEQKAAGLIRSTVSNCSALSQYIATQALTSKEFYSQRQAKSDVMRARCEAVAQTLAAHPEYGAYFTAHPFNSGYFMCLRLHKTSSETLRRLLLDKYQTGGIAIGERDFRIAFSCLELSQIPELFQAIWSACKELAG